ncbi:SDR family NAD(P)-dependent oxidoreductase [Aliarcobacter cryaerophilus]|uniref:SDR family NAD(P)-dependent oxidoreductase n=1 Tax=Aliarcobacter cryaerophilus TaxID=28198 RepID=UPI001654A291|nr:SDR family oxidoreductase [Aliarcobacter cryaerophilus]QNM91533.1 SDR family oxidoreductase [Aliarcobacter cryaerophilus]
MSRIIVITGTRKGIGKELSEYYLSIGNVVVGCSRGSSTVNHENYRHFELDVSDEKAVLEMIRTTKKEFGKIDILLNNAGIASMNHFLTTSYQSVQNIFATNFFGTFLFSREVSKVMMKQKFGRIVNYTTVASPLRLDGEAIYAASKAAIENFTQTISKEVSSYGITVNAVGPTPVETDLIKAVPKNKIEELLEKQAIKRFGNLEDIKNVIDFFIDKKSDFITGQIIYLGGINK